jgi:hypothetical protein
VRPHRDASVSVMRIGHSREPVIVIDNAVEDPQSLVARAGRLQFADDDGRGRYPGVRADASREYGEAVARLAAPLIERTFGLSRRTLQRVDAVYSLVTRRPEELMPIQRVPHVDTHLPGRIAILHYLCRGSMGGTAFFRQVGTGLEQVRSDEVDRFVGQLREDMAGLPAGAGLPDRATPGYIETAHFEARFNRVIAYRTFSLHSASVPRDFTYSSDPVAGRLTGNIFIEYEPTPTG